MPPFDPERIRHIERPHSRLLTLYLVRALLTGPFAPFVLLPLYFKYHTLRYRFDDQGISMSWGLLWRREVYLTYARIQDIHLTRGLLERWLGLATIEIQTASGSGAAEMSIVGLTEYASVRDFLYSRMRGARFGEEESPAPAARGAEDDLTRLLTEIRDEVRALRAALGGRAVP